MIQKCTMIYLKKKNTCLNKCSRLHSIRPTLLLLLLISSFSSSSIATGMPQSMDKKDGCRQAKGHESVVRSLKWLSDPFWTDMQ